MLGSIERFTGILTEHFAGAFPAWLAPVQVAVLPISSGDPDYANKVHTRLKEAGLRAELDVRDEKIGYRIREAELQKVPYMLVVGQKEAEAGTVAVRHHGEGDLGTRSLEEFITEVVDEVAAKR
jgi:threonyl-tRNA synthetase